MSAADPWPLDELLRTLADAAERRADWHDHGPGRGERSRLREAIAAARALLTTLPVEPEACVVGGCTGDGSWRWPALDGGTVPVCATHHDAAASHVQRSGVDDEEALWRAAREGRA